MDNQIKSKARVTSFGEVYTARKQVVDMVDLIGDTAEDIESTVLEPACGNGNFLVEILSRKLNKAKQLSSSHTRYELNTLRAVASIYGVDIQRDNIVECRERLYKQIVGNDDKWTSMFKKMLRNILAKNIMCGDTLTMTANEGGALMISEWDIRENGTAVRKDVLFSEMVANGGSTTNYIKRQYYRWFAEESQLSA